MFMNINDQSVYHFATGYCSFGICIVKPLRGVEKHLFSFLPASSFVKADQYMAIQADNLQC